MNIGIILAGGTGSRFGGDIPKQFEILSGQMVIIHSMATLADSAYINNILVVADEKWRDKIEDALSENPEISEKVLGFSDPGENRQMSIYNALKEIEKMGLSDMTDYVMIHDAARPFISEKIIEESFAALEGHDGAMPVLPMNDTVYYSRTGVRVDELLNRNNVYAGQAPETFDYKKYLKANVSLLPDKILLIKGSTEVAVMSAMDIAMFPGDQRNIKITTRMDMEIAEEMFRERE